MNNLPANDERLTRIENLSAEDVKEKIIQMFGDEFADSIRELPAEYIKQKFLQFFSEKAI